MRASPDPTLDRNQNAPLQLVLCVDRRPNSTEQIRDIRSYLKELRAETIFDLQIVDVGEQPYLAEHFRLVATPALIKLHPEPRQIIAGSNLVVQIEKWWERWQRSVKDYLEDKGDRGPDGNSCAPSASSLSHSAELMQLSDEIFHLKQEKEELLDRLHFKDQLIAMLAHELRNPLTATSLALETLEMTQHQNQESDPKVRAALSARLIAHARTQTRAIEQMISDILIAARTSNRGEFEIHPQILDLKALCFEIIKDFEERFKENSLKFHRDIPNDLPLVYADGERIRQVVVNLLDNAVKYTPQEGKIELSILHRTTQKVQVSIIDNGPGIPEENKKHIFEDRFRLQRDAKKDGYGIGLGLCKRLIRAHFGQIWVDSSPERGSAFHFTLPVYRQ